MKVVISGFGSMGQVLLEEIKVAENIELVGAVDPNTFFGQNSFNELNVVPDIIIEFSHPAVLDDLLEYSINNQVNLVIATTGYSEEEEQKIKDASEKIAILKTGNTSLGITVLNEVVRNLTKVLEGYDIEIIEKHHNKKVDAPSGTAKMFVESIQKEKEINLLYGRKGTSKREINDVTVHAVRGGTIPGEHSIIFAGNDEVIEIKHSALSKRIFATGAIKAARFIEKKENGLFEMKEAL